MGRMVFKDDNKQILYITGGPSYWPVGLTLNTETKQGQPLTSDLLNLMQEPSLSPAGLTVQCSFSISVPMALNLIVP